MKKTLLVYVESDVNVVSSKGCEAVVWENKFVVRK